MNSTPSAQPSQPSAAHKELEQRLAVLTPKDTTRGFLFTAALDVVKSQVGEDAAKRCIEAAGGGSFTAFFSYPVSTLLKVVYTAAKELSGKYGGFDGALHQLGYRVAPRFLESTTGKMLLSLVSNKDPKRLVDSLPTAYRTAWDHGACSMKWLGPKSGRLSYTNAMPVAYFAGSVQQMLAAANLQGIQVTGRQVGLTACEVDFSWE
ncbi:TIGR02265 family protein [Archangium sp.]|jgi:uncharacterized protein (TIGR02265 family)|uniref:TIGR02265 family protein n=1 Tax=Archangium sp. TaxID=1872627 RepID=UPI002ED87519